MHNTFNAQDFFSKFPIIDIGNIRLRELKITDKDRYYEMFSDPEVSQYQSDEDMPKSPNDALEDVKFWGGLFYRKQSIFWAIAEASSDNLIGTVGFNTWNIYNRRAEISYDLMKQYWRQGIMTKVLTNCIRFSFTKMNLNRIEARTMLGNIPSCRLLEKIGFKEEGVVRQYRFVKERFIDIKLFSLLKKEFPVF